MTILLKTTHADEAVANLVQQFKDSPKLAALIRAFVASVQDCEENIYDLFSERLLGTATGVQLDGIGSIVGEARQGQSDIDYRVAIMARIRLIRGSGTPEDLIGLMTTLSGGGQVTLEEYFPASLVLCMINPVVFLGFGFAPFGNYPFGDPPGSDEIPADVRILNRFFQLAKSAGVRADLQYAGENAFGFDDANHGYDEGRWTDVIGA